MPNRTVIGNYLYGAATVSLNGQSPWISPFHAEPSVSWQLGLHGTGGQDGNVPVGSSVGWNSTDHDYTSIYSSGGGTQLYGNAWKRNKFVFTYEPDMQIKLNYNQGTFGGSSLPSTNANFQGIAFIPAANTDGTWFNDPSLLTLHLFQFGGDDEKGNVLNPYHRAYDDYLPSTGGTREYTVPLIENNPFIVGTEYNLVFVNDKDDGFSWTTGPIAYTQFVSVSIGVLKSGLFVAKPGVDIDGAGGGDMLFDSTAPDFMQVLRKSETPITIPTATIGDDGKITPHIKTIETDVNVPYEQENATVLVRWNVLTSTSNLHPTAYPTYWNVPSTDNYAVVPPYLNLDHLNLSNPANTGITHGYSLTARTATNIRSVAQQSPVSLSTNPGDKRREPAVLMDSTTFTPKSITFNGNPSSVIAWCNNSHVFVTTQDGEYIGTVSSSYVNNRSPAWKYREESGGSPGCILTWTHDGASDPGGKGNTVVKMVQIETSGDWATSFSSKITDWGMSSAHTATPYATYGPTWRQVHLVSGSKKAAYVTGRFSRNRVVNEKNEVVHDTSDLTRTPSILRFSDIIWSQTEREELVLYSAEVGETISNPKFGPGGSDKTSSIVFSLKGSSDDSFGRIMIIDNYLSPLARQVSPSYLDCSNPEWSPDGSKILFSASNPRRMCIIDAGSAGTNINPYSLVELTETAANTAAWYTSDSFVSDYNGGANTVVSQYSESTKKVDIIFSNGSPYKEHLVAWSLYRVKGV